MRHSQRANEPLLQVWVICEDDGAIESAHCTCMAGLGEVCSHVGAILFYLESAFRVTQTCTQTDCRWKEPRLVEAIPYARIIDIPFTKPKSLISCNRKRGAHLYSDEVSVVDLPQPSYSLLAEVSVVHPQPVDPEPSVDPEPTVDCESIVEAESSAVERSIAVPESLSIIELDSTVIEPDLEDTVAETELSPATTCTGNEELLLAESPSASLIDDKKKLSVLSDLLQYIPIDAEQTVFLTNIAKFKPVICSIVSPFSDEFKPITPVNNLPPCLQDLYQPHNEELTYSELIAVCEQTKLSITEEEVATIEAATRNQSKSMAWFNQRAGRITASMMKSVCSTDPGNPAQSLIQRICYPDKNKFFSEATKWGCDHESSAKTAYINIMKESHRGFICNDSGLVVSTTHPFIGASPDGSIHCECCGPGVLEIKCPYCVCNDEPSSAPCLVNGKLCRNHMYFYQVQTKLYVCSANYSDFVVGTFCSEIANTSTERILPDDEFVKQCIEKSTDFFELCILPELLAKWYSREEVMPTQTAEASVPTAREGVYIYCYCKQDKKGEMIGCDNKECQHGQWFHLPCLKMKRTPRASKWYCPNCRKLTQFKRKRQRKV